MQKPLTGIAATAALALFASSAQAECAFHNKQVTASNATHEEGVAMSTYDGPSPLPTTAEETAQAATQTDCPDGEKDCVPANE